MVTCDSSCYCSLIRSGRYSAASAGGFGVSIVGAGSGCSGSIVFTNGWSTGSPYTEYLQFGAGSPFACSSYGNYTDLQVRCPPNSAGCESHTILTDTQYFTKVILSSTQNILSRTVSFTFESIINELSRSLPKGYTSGTLAGKTFYLRSFLATNSAVGCQVSELLNLNTIYSSNDTGLETPGCTSCQMNPDFVQYAMVTCDSSCYCSLIRSGRYSAASAGGFGVSIVGAGSGCSGSIVFTNGWSTDTPYTEYLQFGAGSPFTCCEGGFSTFVDRCSARMCHSCPIGLSSPSGHASSPASSPADCTVCARGFYMSAVGCLQCPNQTTTNDTGKTSILDCTAVNMSHVCVLNATWEDIVHTVTRSKQMMQRPTYITGGLGEMMKLDQEEVWVCQFDHTCSQTRRPTNAPLPPNMTDDGFCFIFDEVRQCFKPWGLLSALHLRSRER